MVSVPAINLYGDNNTILSNYITSSKDSGLEIDSCSNHIKNNVFFNCTNGVVVGGERNVIEGNWIKQNTDGISIVSNDNIISENNISDNQVNGICFVSGSCNNIIKANNIARNGDGISLSVGCNGNVITKNDFVDNLDGLHLSFGTYVSVYYPENSKCILNNTICLNDFINNSNTIVVKDKDLDRLNNTFYNSTLQLGNYWSDYNGTDNNGDGIGDTPYNISDGDSQDLYPLMEPYTTGGVSDKKNGDAGIDDTKDETPGFELLLVFLAMLVVSIILIKKRKL